GQVQLLDESGHWDSKTYTAYDSTSKECRIGGMRSFYNRYGTNEGDELVLQILGPERYRLLPEVLFGREMVQLEEGLDRARTDEQAERAVAALGALANVPVEAVVASEYLRLSSEEPQLRNIRMRQ